MINKIILHGRICTDISTKEFDNNNKAANLRIAVKRNYKNQNDEYDTDFFNCSAFGNIAKLLSDYFKKGQEILIIGHLQNRSWETENGEKRYATDIIIDNAEFCGTKGNNDSTTSEQSLVNVVNNEDDDGLPF